MMTRLIRVLRTCALGALVFNALFPLDAISGRKLLYSNPRLLRSTRSGVVCPAYSPCEAWQASPCWPGDDFRGGQDDGGEQVS